VLEVWPLDEMPLLPAEIVDPSPLGHDRLPWQREDESLPPEYERVEVDGGAMLSAAQRSCSLRPETRMRGRAALARRHVQLRERGGREVANDVLPDSPASYD
jgi:hypothetical protein